MNSALRAATVARVRRSVAVSVAAVAALTFLCNLGVLALPLFNMQVFNRVLPTRDFSTLESLGWGLLICLAFWGVLESVRGAAMDIIAARMAGQLSVPLIEAAAQASRPDITAAEGLADIETLRGFVAGRSCLVPFDLVWTPVLLLALLTLHWSMAALALGCIVVMAGLNLIGELLSRHGMMAANQASVVALRQAADSVNAAEAVIALGMLPTLSRTWQRAQMDASNLVQRALLRARAVSALTNAARAGMTGGMVALGLYIALNGYAQSGAMVGGNMILARVLLPFANFAATRRQWMDAAAAWVRLRAALETGAPHRYTVALPPPEPRLVVENLSYLPPGGDRALLRGVSFTVEPGEAVAVIGPSSAGKSTLLRLVAGLVPPTTGGVYLDGTSTLLWEREDFARHVGFMPQRPTLLEESVADNIARLQDAEPALVLSAAKRAGVHKVIAALPQGYATRLQGHALSAGQRQRVALARALFRAPKLLLLDEPSAFLDDEGESEIRRLLATLKQEGVTLLVVTHRPALLSAMDKALVLRDGMVAQFGPVAEIEPSVRKRPVRLVRAAERELV